MQPEWTLTYDPHQMAHVLSDGKRKAWFAVKEFMMDHPLRIEFRPSDPFNGLAAMIAMGLRPYRTEGDFEGFGGIADTKVLFHAA